MTPPLVRPVQTAADRATFIDVAYTMYDRYPAWVPPLKMDRRKLMDTKKNPFYKHATASFFLAERDGRVVGRIGAILNENHDRVHNEKAGFFGFFECIDDEDVSRALFDAAAEFLRERGAQVFRGPATPSVNDEFGMLVEGFDKPPTVLMPYNPDYYPRLVEAYGFTKAKDLYAYRMSQREVYSEKLERANQIVRQRYGLDFRTLDMKRYREEVAKIKDLYNNAWAHNWGAVPMTDDEIDALAKDLKPVVVPELVVFAEKGGVPIGFALSLPDIHQALRFNTSGGLLTGLWHLFTKKKHIDTVRVIVLGVLPEFQHTGAAGVLFYETAVNARRLGYAYGEASWVLEDNGPMNRAAAMLKGVVEKRYRLYERPLTPPHHTRESA